jgi:hypothetical protein
MEFHHLSSHDLLAKISQFKIYFTLLSISSILLQHTEDIFAADDQFYVMQIL